MIDIENIVINTVSTALGSYLTDYPDLKVGSMYTDTPSKFPYVSITEDDNSTYEQSHTELQEEHAVVNYTINVFTNNTGEEKKLAKDIVNTIDTAMQGMKFTRIMSGQVPNIDRTIYRYTLRYDAIVQKGVNKSGTITYQMYHNV